MRRDARPDFRKTAWPVLMLTNTVALLLGDLFTANACAAEILRREQNGSAPPLLVLDLEAEPCQ